MATATTTVGVCAFLLPESSSCFLLSLTFESFQSIIHLCLLKGFCRNYKVCPEKVQPPLIYKKNGLCDIRVTGSQGEWTGMRMCEQ